MLVLSAFLWEGKKIHPFFSGWFEAHVPPAQDAAEFQT